MARTRGEEGGRSSILGVQGGEKMARTGNRPTWYLPLVQQASGPSSRKRTVLSKGRQGSLWGGMGLHGWPGRPQVALDPSLWTWGATKGSVPGPAGCLDWSLVSG